jgi:hypothetical protein
MRAWWSPCMLSVHCTRDSLLTQPSPTATWPVAGNFSSQFVELLRTDSNNPMWPDHENGSLATQASRIPSERWSMIPWFFLTKGSDAPSGIWDTWGGRPRKAVWGHIHGVPCWWVARAERNMLVWYQGAIACLCTGSPLARPAICAQAILKPAFGPDTWSCLNGRGVLASAVTFL